MDHAPVFPGARQGLFITLEGVEGSGKTTQIPRLAEFLESRGMECVRTREPGGTAIGARLRAVLLDPGNHHLHPLCELLLYEADRVQHVAEVIVPNLSAGRAVVCDRFFDATTVYQGYARRLSRERIQDLHDWLFAGLVPDLTLIFDLPAEVGLSRARARLADDGTGEGRFEEEQLKFHERVRAGYLDLARENPGRFRVVDADAAPEKVAGRMTSAVAAFLDARAAVLSEKVG